MNNLGPRDKTLVNDELTETEQLQIMEAYAEAEDNFFLELDEDDYLFEPEE